MFKIKRKIKKKRTPKKENVKIFNKREKNKGVSQNLLKLRDKKNKKTKIKKNNLSDTVLYN